MAQGLDGVGHLLSHAVQFLQGWLEGRCRVVGEGVKVYSAGAVCGGSLHLWFINKYPNIDLTIRILYWWIAGRYLTKIYVHPHMYRDAQLF